MRSRIGDVAIEDAALFRRRGYRNEELVGEALGEALVVRKVKELVLDDRTAERAAELVPVQVGLSGADQVRGPGRRRQVLVAVVIPAGAVQADSSRDLITTLTTAPAERPNSAE